MEKCNCTICKNCNKFVMPEDIIKAVEKEELVLFCGAGVSTESKLVLPQTFYMSIHDELEKRCGEDISLDITFSELMSLFVEKIPNGRRILIMKIKERFDYIESFPQLYNMATRFHQEVSKNPYIKTIITTNWDTYFEDICGCTTIIDDNDTALWNVFDKRVFKIHGSISNIGSIVATKDDYKKSYKRLSEDLIGDRLKTILSSNTILFIGFSFGDEDLNKIIDTLSDKMGEFTNQYYLVTTDKRWESNTDKRIIPIITDGTYFIHNINLILNEKGIINSYELYEYAKEIRGIVNSIHIELTNSKEFQKFFKEYPELLLSIAYQDGFIHSLERCIANKKYGEYLLPNYFEQYITSYHYLFQKRVDEGNFDMAYYNLGYSDGLLSLYLFTKDNKGGLPGIFVFNEENFENVNKVCDFIKINRVNKIYEFCKKRMLEIKNEVPHYMPWFY